MLRGNTDRAPVSSSCNLAVSAFPTGAGISCAAGTSDWSVHTENKTFSYPLLHSSLLFLFYSFPINTYRYNLPW